MTVVVHTDILVSLQAMHGDVQRRFAELDRYRALKAIEQTIADFPDLDDVAHSLGDIRDRVQQQLDGTREFLALRSIERILPELSDVLILLGEETGGKGDTASCTPNPGTESLADVEQVGSALDALPVGDRDGVSPADAATATVDIETVALTEAPEQPEDLSGPMTDPAHDAIADKVAGTTLGDRLSPRLESDPPASEAAPVPSLADSVAQLMAQAVVPPSRDPPTASDWSAGTDARPQSPAERAA
jgi:hypothetical protein